MYSLLCVRSLQASTSRLALVNSALLLLGHPWCGLSHQAALVSNVWTTNHAPLFTVVAPFGRLAGGRVGLLRPSGQAGRRWASAPPRAHRRRLPSPRPRRRRHAARASRPTASRHRPRAARAPIAGPGVHRQRALPAHPPNCRDSRLSHCTSNTITNLCTREIPKRPPAQIDDLAVPKRWVRPSTCYCTWRCPPFQTF